MFLVSEEHEIMLIASDEDRDLREACAMVVDLLIEFGRKKKVTGKQLQESKVQRNVTPISS